MREAGRRGVPQRGAGRGRPGREGSLLGPRLSEFPAADHGAALAVIQNFVAQFADWSDEDIAVRVVEGMGHASTVKRRCRKRKRLRTSTG